MSIFEICRPSFAFTAVVFWDLRPLYFGISVGLFSSMGRVMPIYDWIFVIIGILA
jgi:hypothetical protein